MTIVVRMDDFFTLGDRARCDEFGRDLDHMATVLNLGESCLGIRCDFVRGIGRRGASYYNKRSLNNRRVSTG